MSDAARTGPAPGAAPASGAPVAPTPATFEEALRELGELVGRLERGETGLEEALAAWERGEQLVRFCLVKLDAAQGRIEVLGQDPASDEPDA